MSTYGPAPAKRLDRVGFFRRALIINIILIPIALICNSLAKDYFIWMLRNEVPGYELQRTIISWGVLGIWVIRELVMLSLYVKRWQDLNVPGVVAVVITFLLIILEIISPSWAIFLNILYFAFMLFTPGTVGANDFGDDPVYRPRNTSKFTNTKRRPVPKRNRRP